MPFVNGPVFAFCAALALVWALGAEAEGPERSAWRRLVIVLSIFSIAKFCAPYLLNEHVAFIKEATRAKQSLFASGPMKGYFVEETSGYAFGSFEEAERRIDARLQLEKSSEFITTDEDLWPYLWKDGLDLLERVEGGRNLRVVSFYKAAFPFMAGTKVSAKFPLYSIADCLHSMRISFVCRRTLMRSWCCERTSAIPYTDGTNSRCARISTSPSHLDFGICTNDALCKKAHRRIGSLRAAALAADIAG